MFAAPNLLLTPTMQQQVMYINSGTAEATTITIPTGHQSGDYLVMFAFRDGSTSLPTLPSGWTSIQTQTGSTCCGRLAYKVAASSSETSGTWTSATGLVCHVYRNVGFIGACVSTGPSASATVNYPADSLENGFGSSYVAGFAGHRSINGSLATPPTGMTNRSVMEGATNDLAGHDTNGAVASWSSTNVVTTETSSGYVTFVVELIPPGLTLVLFETIGTGQAGNLNSFSFATTVAVGDYVILDVAADRTSTFTSVQYGSQTMTQLGSTVTLTAGNSGNAVMRRYGVVATAANGTITGTVSATPWMVANSASYRGVGSVGSTTTATGSSGPSQAVTCSPGQIIVQSFGITPGAGVSFGTLSGGSNRYSNVTASFIGLAINDAAVSTTFASTSTNAWGGIATILDPA